VVQAWLAGGCWTVWVIGCALPRCVFVTVIRLASQRLLNQSNRRRARLPGFIAWFSNRFASAVLHDQCFPSLTPLISVVSVVWLDIKPGTGLRSLTGSKTFFDMFYLVPSDYIPYFTSQPQEWYKTLKVKALWYSFYILNNELSISILLAKPLKPFIRTILQ
jgi:hypothetical protein